MRRSRVRATAYLPDSFQRQLNAYALAAGAAGVGALALGASAEAKVIYTHKVHVVGHNQIYKFSLDHSSVPDFELKNVYSCSDICPIGTLFALPLGQHDGVVGNWRKGVFRSYKCAYPLPAGAIVGPKRPFSGTLLYSVGSSNGEWNHVKSAYLGLKFRIDGKVHYGWARLSVNVDNFSMKLSGYAYETAAEKPIQAGDEGNGESTPSGTLGELTLGRK